MFNNIIILYIQCIKKYRILSYTLNLLFIEIVILKKYSFRRQSPCLPIKMLISFISYLYFMIS